MTSILSFQYFFPTSTLEQACRRGELIEVQDQLNNLDSGERRKVLKKRFDRQQTLFHIAAENKNWDVLLELLSHKEVENVNAQDNERRTCLYWVFEGHFDLAEFVPDYVTFFEK